MSREVIILAGGLGTRLREVVHDLPKPLAPVAGRPFLAWLLDRMVDEGVEHVVLATGYLADRIESALGHSWRGVPLTYAVETQPLGTGGAVRNAVTMTGENGVHIINGDTYLRYSLEALESSTRSAGMNIGMALAEVDDTSRYGAVGVDRGRVKKFAEKGTSGPGLINAGCYYLDDHAIKQLPERSSFSLERDFLESAVDGIGIAAYRDTSGFIDIGIPVDYARAQQLFRQVECP
ncbi:nucleotidyltransferase family protein [Pseudoxanthomonas beigongshangi]